MTANPAAIPKRPPDRTLTIHARDIADALTPWEVKVRSAHLLYRAGFKFTGYDGVKGDFLLAPKWLRTPHADLDAITFEQWDDEP